ncbi:MAG: pyridoxal-phosphate dependent enzyme [Gemmatimonadaceae bacterium]|nr:pyridoxal-phosphate dependent enzyme [Gemmatimonadaceae bacterium]
MSLVEARRVTTAGIARAAQGISPVFTQTPVVHHDDVDGWLGAHVSCKVESLGPLRSFKGRGGDWFMRQRAGTGPVCAASAGNFGQALAYAARAAGVPCTMFAASHASPLKVARMRALGATVIQDGDDFDAAKEAARAYAREHAIEFVEDGQALAITEGAGSIAVELANAVTLDTLLVPLGNGALLAGVATWMKAVSPSTRIVGVVAEGAPSMMRALTGIQVDHAMPVATIADGIAVRVPVKEAVDDLRALADDLVAVSDDAIVAAMRGLIAHLGLVIEPAGAVGIAALLTASHGAYGGTCRHHPLRRERDHGAAQSVGGAAGVHRQLTAARPCQRRRHQIMAAARARFGR